MKFINAKKTFVVIVIIVSLALIFFLFNKINESRKLSNNTDLNLSISDNSPDVRKKINVDIFSEDLGPIRLLTWGPHGTLLASVTRNGRVIALPDNNKDGKADRVVNVITGLRLPHGITFFENNLYIAEEHQIIKLLSLKDDFTFDKKITIIKKFPQGGNHFTRTIAIGPDKKLYIALGSSCNACFEENPWRSTVLQANLDGSDINIFATGLRNSVGITFRPDTNEIWGTDNGRDWLGDNAPPDEINIIQENKNYGWPLCYGNKIHDTTFDKKVYVRNPCEDTQAPYIELPAHVAPLGLRFYTGKMFSEFQGDLFVAYHGSWNRSIPIGYKVVRFDINNSHTIKEYDFIDIWLQKNSIVTGRPVDIIFGEEGEMYISDDKEGRIYRVTR